jgi:hypothetical protein
MKLYGFKTTATLAFIDSSGRYTRPTRPFFRSWNGVSYHLATPNIKWNSSIFLCYYSFLLA